MSLGPSLAMRRLQMRCQLHALCFAAGERSRGLSQPQISQPDFVQHAQFLGNLRNLGKELAALPSPSGSSTS